MVAPHDAKILLIEDNEDDIELARRVFEDQNILDQVHIIRDGKEAINFLFGTGAYAGQGVPQALRMILLDIQLPSISGFDILRRVKDTPTTRHIRVVMLTSSDKEKEILNSYIFGTQSYMIKPIDAPQFKRIYQSLESE